MNAVPTPRPSTSTAPVDAGQSAEPAKFGALSNCAWMFLMTPEFGGSPHPLTRPANPTIATTRVADLTYLLNMFLLLVRFRPGIGRSDANLGPAACACQGWCESRGPARSRRDRRPNRAAS